MSAKALQILVLPHDYVVARLESPAQLGKLPPLERAMVSLTLTPDECSFIGPASVLLGPCVSVSPGWRCLRVDGTLAFDQVGVVSTVSTAIASGGISLFAVSSHDRDHFLVQHNDLPSALDLLDRAGCDINRPGAPEALSRQQEKP